MEAGLEVAGVWELPSSEGLLVQLVA